MINERNGAVSESTHKTIRDLFTRFYVCFEVACMCVVARRWNMFVLDIVLHQCVCLFCRRKKKALANVIIVMWLRFCLQFLSDAHKLGLPCIFISRSPFLNASKQRHERECKKRSTRNIVA